MPEISWVLVHLPSSIRESATLQDDVDAVCQAIPSGPIVLVAHSYGGAVASAAAHLLPNLTQIIFVSALVPHVGESATQAARRWPGRSRLDDGIQVKGDALVLTRQVARKALFEDVRDDEVEHWLDGLALQSSISFSSPRPEGIWNGRSTYILCTRDQALDPALQALQIPDGSRVERIESDHTPMVSHPQELATLIRGILASDIGHPPTLLK